jgi:hypothetical protein
VAKKQMANLLEEVMKTPDYWLSRLATLEYRGVELDDLLDAPAQYQRFTVQDVKDTFGRYDRPEARLSFVVTPR